MLIFGIGIPAVALLGYQALTFTDGGLEIAPFMTFDLWAYHYNPLANTLLPLKFLLSIAFPLAVYLAYFPRARRDTAFNLAWLCVAVGMAWTYLFADSGDRVAGNLVWNGQSAVLILYVATLLFWLRENPWLNAGKLPRSYWRFALCALVFALHRAGPGTKIVCLGNLAQIDTPYLTEGSSGLTFAVDRFKGWPHSGHITLARGERSRLADFASEVL
jgi:hypothetical protein